MMPGMDGLGGALARSRPIPDLADIPVVMLTIVDDRNLRLRARRRRLSHQADRPRAPGGGAAASTGATARYWSSTTTSSSASSSGACSSRRATRWWRPRTAGWRSSSLREGPPSVILLDLMMPEMDGFEFVAEFRRARGLAAGADRRHHRQGPDSARTASGSTAMCRRFSRRAPTAATQLLAEVRDLVAIGVALPETEAPDGQDPARRGQRDEPRHALAPPRQARLRGGHRRRRRAGRGHGASERAGPRS